MQANGFAEAVEFIVQEDPRFHPEAYAFLREGLSFTMKQLKRNQSESRHVSGPELMDGLRVYALREFGPMVPTVFDFWGVNKTGDFGDMVFSLIEAGIFGKNDTDSKEDFRDCYDFHEAFVVPFLPEAQVAKDEREPVGTVG